MPHSGGWHCSGSTASTQPATASAVQHLLELRHRMVAAEFLVTAWPPLIVASSQNGGDQSPGKR